ncbi:site-specific integrase (plasmid) [Microtetraspora malaysiensis]|uniref:site-specific integrase n=1 Tax=Microtetraspora malaysiensis TaxID=161358 RepID=UPI003D8AD413
MTDDPRNLPAVIDGARPAIIPTGAGELDDTLTEEAARLVFEGMAENTRIAYAHDWHLYIRWCADTGRTPIPATGATLANYVAHMTAVLYAPSSIDRAIACILAAHDHAGAPKPNTKAARLALRAYSRERTKQGHRTRKAPPITIDRLRAMIAALPSDTSKGIRDRAILVLGFALMGRRSELAALDITDLSFTEDGIEVHIATSKTDKDSHGETIPIPYGTHRDTCPVRVLKAWLDILRANGIISGALLRPIDRHDNIGGSGPKRAGRGAGDRITGQTVNIVVKRAALLAGLDNPSSYSAHGLRAGGATSAARSGAPMSAITSHGRWVDGSPVVAGYIRQVDRWNDNPMRGIGL